MADILLEVAGGAKKKLQDMGDGTHAEVVAVKGDSGGGGSGTVEVSNFPETQAVSGTVSVTDLATAGSTNMGVIAAAAYADADGEANGTVIGLLKGIYVLLSDLKDLTEAGNLHLNQIEENTTPDGG